MWTMENNKLVKDIENSPFYRATRRKTALRYKVTDDQRLDHATQMENEHQRKDAFNYYRFQGRPDGWRNGNA